MAERKGCEMEKLDRAEWLRYWESWCRYIASGGTESWPRDAFESLLDWVEELQGYKKW